MKGRWWMVAVAWVVGHGEGLAEGATPWTQADIEGTFHAKALPEPPRFTTSDGWQKAGFDGIRGMTIGPIENGYHPGVGYGSPAYEHTVDFVRRMGANWVAITPFGRVNDVSSRGVDPTFEVPHAENRAAVAKAIAQAHAQGLRVFLVPHLWVESGAWRALMDPKGSRGWDDWAESYERFVTTWATVAEENHVEMLSTGVELRSWVTTSRAPSFSAIVRRLRRVYHGVLTYSSNWDDAEDTVIFGDVDVVGINAFYPLADHDGATETELRAGGRKVLEKVRSLADLWNKPVLFTEIGYTNREDPAIRPWEWPDAMSNVKLDPSAQALAYRSLLAPVLDDPHFIGFFVWRIYSDLHDVSQESEWGFSPLGKAAEHVVRDAFAAPWAVDSVKRWPWGPRSGSPRRTSTGNATGSAVAPHREVGPQGEGR